MESLSPSFFDVVAFGFSSFKSGFEEQVDEASDMDCDSFAFVDALIWDDVPDLDEKRGMLKCAVDSKGNFCS